MTLMIFLLYFFWTTCVLCFLSAFRFGERDEKRGMVIITTGSVTTGLIASIASYDFRDIAIWFLAIDLCVLFAFVRLSFASRKYWPIWVGSLQMISVVIHLLNLILPKTLPAAYAMLQGFWVYPMFFAVMAGTYGSHMAARRKQSQASSL